jgi:hypothetical protein
MVWERLKRLFGGRAAEPGDDGIYVYVRSDRCGESVRVRLSPRSELQQDFESGGYSVRKMIVDGRCFRPIELNMTFDSGRREQSREIEGGSFITREEYEASRPTPGA